MEKESKGRLKKNSRRWIGVEEGGKEAGSVGGLSRPSSPLVKRLSRTSLGLAPAELGFGEVSLFPKSWMTSNKSMRHLTILGPTATEMDGKISTFTGPSKWSESLNLLRCPLLSLPSSGYPSSLPLKNSSGSFIIDYLLVPMPFEKTHERFKKILEGSGKEEEGADRAMWVSEGKETRGPLPLLCSSKTYR
jgi:hypothetical protein